MNFRVDREDKQPRSGCDEQQAEPDQPSRRDAGREARGPHCDEEHRERHGQQRDPGFERILSEYYLQVERHQEEDPSEAEEHHGDRAEACAQLRQPEHREVDEGVTAAGGEPRSHAANAAIRTSPAAIRKGTTERPNGSTVMPRIVGTSLVSIQPQVDACTTPRTASAKPVAENSAPTTDQFGPPSGERGVGDDPRGAEEADHDDRLGGEDVPP